MKWSKLFVFLSALGLFLISCIITTSKDPVFNGDLSTLKKNIDSIIKCDTVVFAGKEIKENRKVTFELIVELVNPENIAADSAQLRNKSIQIARIAREALKDSKSVNIYRIVFQYRNQGVIKNWKLFKAVVIKSDQI
jgi:hypothetical protein